jgi:hypothetical protein
MGGSFIIIMWLAVLFVGVFGGDFVSSSSANGFTKIPVVVFLLPFALPATIVVARRGFTSGPEERQTAPDETTQTREQAASQRQYSRRSTSDSSCVAPACSRKRATNAAASHLSARKTRVWCHQQDAPTITKAALALVKRQPEDGASAP